VTAAPLMAAGAAACGVAAAWELVLVVEGFAPRRLIAPLLAAGRSGPSTAERRRLAVVAAASLLAAGWIVMGPVPGMLLGAVAPAAVGKTIAWRRARWRRELASGAGVAARALADALAGGHSVRGAIGEAGGLPGAVGEQLREAARALALGERTEVVLEGLRARARDASWDAIVAAISLQRTSGGDLARLLRDLAGAIDERARSEADARAATAQARMTAWIVAALPAGAAALAQLADPHALGTLTATGPSTALACAALVCEVSGVLVVRALVRKAGRL
jgi:tight adherence protein B